MSYQEHTKAAETHSARCAIVTLSDTRDEKTDISGQKIHQLLAGSHHVVDYKVIRDEEDVLHELLNHWLARSDVDLILSTGGTGVSRRDRTIHVVERLIQIPLPGFGELFRRLSWEEIGSGAMLSRATAGIADGKLIFAMPGSTAAVELAMTRLILPELKHLLRELRK